MEEKVIELESKILVLKELQVIHNLLKRISTKAIIKQNDFSYERIQHVITLIEQIHNDV